MTQIKNKWDKLKADWTIQLKLKRRQTKVSQICSYIKWVYYRTKCSYYGCLPWWVGHRSLSLSSLELELCIGHYSLAIYGQLYVCIRMMDFVNYLSLVIYGQLFEFDWWTLLIIYHGHGSLLEKKYGCFIFSNKLMVVIWYYMIFQLAKIISTQKCLREIKTNPKHHPGAY
jgi:hypothetical protein